MGSPACSCMGPKPGTPRLKSPGPRERRWAVPGERAFILRIQMAYAALTQSGTGLVLLLPVGPTCPESEHQLPPHAFWPVLQFPSLPPESASARRPQHAAAWVVS